MIKDFTAVLSEKKNLAGPIWWFRFELSEDLDFKAGQYLLLKVRGQYRQYSIASMPSDKRHIELIVEYFEGGLASTFLAGLEPGGVAEFKGPAGVFTLRPNDTDKIFLATGTGIAPIKSMIETYLAGGGAAQLRLFFGLRTRNDRYLQDFFTDLAQKHPTFSFWMCLSREERVEDLPHTMSGRVTVAFDRFLAEGQDPHSFEYYICGGKRTVEALTQFVKDHGIERDTIYFENFG